MRIILDTNVLVSGMINPDGPPGKILNLVARRKVIVYVDARIEYEYSDVLSRQGMPFTTKSAREVLDRLQKVVIRITADPLHIQVPDPDDLMFIEVAVEAQADCIVTGNKRHFPKAATKNISVLSPSEFMQLIGDIKKPD
jgi:putative PIN family toxin of toxin-antitoxin system